MVSDIRLVNGCGIELLKSLPAGSVDLIMTDPPYGHNNNNGDLIQNARRALGKGEAGPGRPILNDDFDSANRLFSACIKEAARVLKAGCCCCCCCGGGGGGPDPQFARWSLLIDETKGLKFKQMVVWDKGPIGMGWHYRRSYETVLVAERIGARCAWYDTSRKVENIIRHIKKIIPNKEQHPTPKPVKLMEHFITLHTQPGDLVVDPFMGGGTTAIACRNLGRRFLGAELDETFFKMAKDRLSV